jgi:hypothetical protein
MTTTGDPEVERMLVEHVASFEKLELLSLAWRERTAWTVAAASAKLRIGDAFVESALAELAAIGLLVRARGGYEFPSSGGELHRIAERLCALYERDRVVVLSVLTSESFKRLRLTTARTFADAFRIRKRGPGDPTGGDHG